LYAPLSDKNILYEIGDFKLNAAQIVSIFYDYFAELHQQSWGKTLRFYKRCSRLSKFYRWGLIVFGFVAEAEFGMRTGRCLDVTNTKCRNRFVVAYSGTALISGISAALVGSMFSSVAWEG
jgi:APA family basic amino acid/polyamine antiporter